MSGLFKLKTAMFHFKQLFKMFLGQMKSQSAIAGLHTMSVEVLIDEKNNFFLLIFLSSIQMLNDN